MSTTFDHDTLTVTGDFGTVIVAASPVAGATTLYDNAGTLVALGVTPTGSYTRTINLLPASTTEATYLTRYLAGLIQTSKRKVAVPAELKRVPSNYAKPTAAVWTAMTPLMTLLGIDLTAPAKPAGGKPRHSWRKTIATVPFTTTYQGTQATVYWVSRSAMVIKAGAQLKAEAPLNADGTLGFSARFAQQLRSEHADAIDANWRLTTDVTLKSVNEVGLFLYFGGTNSWLHLFDPAGHTLHELTVVA